MSEEVQVGSSNVVVKLDFTDSDGANKIPTSVSYKVLGRETESDAWTEIVALTGLAGMAASMSISVMPPVTTLLGSGPQEERQYCFYVDSAFWKSINFDLVDSGCSS